MAKRFIGTDSTSINRMAEIAECVNSGLPVLLSVKEVSKVTGYSIVQLNKYRRIGGGPEFKRIGVKLIRYPLETVMSWIDTPLQSSTRVIPISPIE